jgi:hypothetical protein
MMRTEGEEKKEVQVKGCSKTSKIKRIDSNLKLDVSASDLRMQESVCQPLISCYKTTNLVKKQEKKTQTKNANANGREQNGKGMLYNKYLATGCIR